jgi:hypothetical protein
LKIKGSALLARREIVVHRFGDRAWANLIADMAGECPSFRSPIVAASQVPVDEFLAFHDELVRRFFSGDPGTYHDLGDQSAEWALTKGPYKNFLARKDVPGYVEAIPSLSSAYWTDAPTSYRATLQGDTVEFEVSGLPLWHPYFEYFVVAYNKRALELVSGKRVEMSRVRGGSGASYFYRFRFLPES